MVVRFHGSVKRISADDLVHVCRGHITRLYQRVDSVDSKLGASEAHKLLRSSHVDGCRRGQKRFQQHLGLEYEKLLRESKKIKIASRWKRAGLHAFILRPDGVIRGSPGKAKADGVVGLRSYWLGGYGDATAARRSLAG